MCVNLLIPLSIKLKKTCSETIIDNGKETTILEKGEGNFFVPLFSDYI